MAMAGFSVSGNGRFLLCVKSIDDKLYPCHVVLTTKAKDRRLRRSAKEKLSYTARRNVLTCVLPPGPSRQRQLFRASPKNQSTCFGSNVFAIFFSYVGFAIFNFVEGLALLFYEPSRCHFSLCYPVLMYYYCMFFRFVMV